MDARYVFVGGLHRSGTTLVADCLEAHPEVRGLPHSAAPEGEGVFLQGAIPHDARAGVPGEWAEDPAMHMIEGGPWDRAEVAERLRRDWDRWYAPGGAWRVEKSPVNLLRARLYQQLFPAAQFVFVVRHPVAGARATAKWSDRGEPALLAHWEHAHGLWSGDVPRLHNWMVLRFEDLCAEPEAQLARLFGFLRLEPVAPPRGVRGDPNADYLGDAAPVGAMGRRFGYGPDGVTGPSEWRGRHWFRDVREVVG